MTDNTRPLYLALKTLHGGVLALVSGPLAMRKSALDGFVVICALIEVLGRRGAARAVLRRCARGPLFARFDASHGVCQ